MTSKRKEAVPAVDVQPSEVLDASGDASAEAASSSNSGGGPEILETTTQEIAALVPASCQQNTLDRHARVRVRAMDIDHTNKAARIRFMAELGGDYVRGETPAILADVWGMKVATVETDASIAGLFIKFQADPEIAHSVYWQDVYAELDIVQDLRSKAAAVFERALVGDVETIDKHGDPQPIDAMGLKFISDAFDRAAAAADRCREKIGKASGLIQSGTTQAIQINIGGANVSAPASEASRLLSLASSFFTDRHPELAEEFRAYLTEGQ